MSADFDAALDALDFDAAAAFLDGLAGEERAELSARLDQAHAEAEQRAEELAGRVQSMARADHYEGLLALVEDPVTDVLLGLLSPEIRRGATLHLEGAQRRRQRFQSAAVDHMEQAASALALLDTTKARAELDRVESRWLDEAQRSRLEDLHQQAEDAAVERRDLDARTAEVLRDHHPSQTPRVPGSSRRPGCASSALALMALLVALTN